jgi:hypothetical protein
MKVQGSSRARRTLIVAVVVAACFLSFAAAARAVIVKGAVSDPRGDVVAGVTGTPADIESMSVRMNERQGRLVVVFTLYRPLPTGLPGVPGGLLGPAVFPEANVSCGGGDIALQDSFATFYIGDESSFPHVSLRWELHGTKVVARLTDPRIAGLSCHTADGGVFGSGGQLEGSFDAVSPFSLQ